MLPQNDPVRKLLRVKSWHDAGHRGDGNVVILDGDDGKPRKGMQPYLTDVLGTATESGHASNVAQVIHEFAPDAHVWYFNNTTTAGKDAAFNWIRDNKDRLNIRFVNVSLAGLHGMETPDFLRYQGLGITLVCGAGNDDSETWISYPARYTGPCFIAVGASNRLGTSIAGYSNEGPGLDVVDPSGVYIQREDGYIWPVDGTSFAAPTTTGLLQVYAAWRELVGLQDMTTAEVEAFVWREALDIMTLGYDTASGYGLFRMPETIPTVPKEVPMSTPYNRTIQGIVIHHMGDKLPPEVSILQRWNPDNLDYPEYDYGVEADGTIQIGRPLSIQGAHTLSDKAPYSQRGYQWWNRNTIGIGLAGDFTIYSMPQAQLDGLVSLVKSLMTDHDLTLDNVFPHGQVTYTDCPGCVYSKVPELTKGKWSYDEFEMAVLGPTKEEEYSMQDAVVYWTLKDFSAAEQVAAKLGGCGMFCRNGNPALHRDAKTAKHLVVIGGPEVTDHPNVTNKCGFDGPATAILAAQYAQTL